MHSWKFFRTGGLDQVALESGEDLLNLEHLDQKLWVALSCPVKGLEIDEATLKLVDTDGDGRIRVPELLAAIKWAAPRLKDAGVLLAGQDGLPLAAINNATPEGKTLLASAKQILDNLGRKGATVISVVDSSTRRRFSPPTRSTVTESFLRARARIPRPSNSSRTSSPASAAPRDRTGEEGVTVEQVDKFFADLNNYVRWTAQSAVKDIAILGDATAAAVAAVQAARAKVDDYFGRCRLAAFDSRATAALKPRRDRVPRHRGQGPEDHG
ncbi:MAG: EF-hand domain-containing protein [Lacunisphaera sp.]